MEIQNLHFEQADFRDRLDAIRDKLSPAGDIVSPAGRQRTMEVFGEPLTAGQVVTRICNDVRDRGLGAVIEYGNRLDHVQLSADQLRVPPEAMAAAHAAADDDFLSAVRRIRDNIHAFQSAILHQDVHVEGANGEQLRQRYLPLKRVGLCIPGGAAAYPSSLLMTAVPAQAAGVEEIVVVAPPSEFGARNPDILAVCHELGITEIYQVGGAQAVAALAYGAASEDPGDELSIRAVDKIVGPGNLFVALAKKHVYGVVDIDSIAGPSEVAVIADESTNPIHAAAEMMAQAEHSPGSSILITWHKPLIENVESAIAERIGSLSRSDLIERALVEFAAMILVKDADQACEVANFLAPEHLYIGTADPEQLLGKIRNAGATFLGEFTPVAVGDYFAGPSHVLPTGGTPRWASGLSSNSFLRSSSVIQFDQAALQNAAEDIRLIARREQLTAHADSIDVRLP